MRASIVQPLLAGAVVLGVVGLFYSGLLTDPCKTPLTYRVGELDERFNISSSTARALLAEAEAVWEQEFERELFIYDPEADFAVNFIYDERQETTNTVNEYESTLSDLEMSHSEVTRLYEERKQRYETALEAYQERHEAYEADLRAYNQRVSQWNDQGGAPPAVYSELQAERDALDARLAALQTEQQQVESLRQSVNELVTQGNSLAREYNQTASTFVDRFGEAREFNQATYDGDAINVYQFEQLDDLRLALAHEFGHTFGIEHVDNPESVMYYLMEDQPLDNPQLTAADIAAFNTVCTYE